MNIVAIIPARMGSTRFPGKPLAEIHGMPMIGHVYFRCKLSKKLSAVYIATCDEEIRAYAESIGAPCIMTKDTHERCSDRTAEAMLEIEQQIGKSIDIVVMVQGDEPMVTPSMVDHAIEPLLLDPDVMLSNLMGVISTIDDFEDPNEVKVVVDSNAYALYFSREPIPSRKKGYIDVSMYKQVCVIPFRRDYLLYFNALKPTYLEEVESVDMLRVLESGGKVKMVLTHENNCSVDTPDDLVEAQKLMKNDILMHQYLIEK